MYRLGIDMGGTKTAAGIVDEAFNLVAEKTIPTNVLGGRRRSWSIHCC